MPPKLAVRSLSDWPRQASDYLYLFLPRTWVSLLEGQVGRDPFRPEPQCPCPRNLAHS